MNGADKLKEKNRPEETLSASAELQIQKVVEERFRNLPATTYELIETMVEKRVAQVEKFYRWTGIIALTALTFVAVGFFKVTASNAVRQVSETITSSKLGEKLKEIDDAHSASLSSRDTIIKSRDEATRVANNLSERLRTLENQDNIVRYTGMGVIDVWGTFRMRYGPNATNHIDFFVDTSGTLQITDGKQFYFPLDGKYLRIEQ